MSNHINAQPGDIAPTVLLPGDPRRAKYIAHNFLQDVVQYNEVRNMWGYTGTDKHGKNISVIGTGMGMPSLGIYVMELIKDYGAQSLIRLGSCGALQAGINCREVIIAMAACSDSNMNKRRFKGLNFSPIASPLLLRRAWEAAEKFQITFHVGNIFSTDMYYDDIVSVDKAIWETLADAGVLGIEMETSELYTLGARKKVEVLAINTVSDNLVTGEKLSNEERERSFDDMVKIALEL